MKTIITSILLLGLSLQVSANTFFTQLCEFNPNWENYELRVPDKEAILFSSEVEYIQAHLTSVLSILRSNSTDHLNSEQFKSRHHLIEVLDAYRAAGNFPINYYRNERIPVFIDEHNTHCAVGFLMQETGFESLAREISTTDNYIWVKDISDARVLQWQAQSGFTLEELKIIQGAYDIYMENAFYLPNRYEIPQKPACATAYFQENRYSGEELAHEPENIWFYGEGKNGVLNGRWEQNYAVGIPWIVGYYRNGERTGQWMEYYQGTDILCRTENWRDDKLNGVRIRFDREGNIVEEILFKDGNAITKTNYDRAEDMKSIRTPLDSVNIHTEVYTMSGRLLATGNERVHNPSNLLWFQNIELTALNSVAITARSYEQNNDIQLFNGSQSGFFDPNRRPMRSTLFQTPSLVEYKKEGKWVYYHDADLALAGHYDKLSISNRIKVDFRHFEDDLSQMTTLMDDKGVKSQFDSIVVEFENNLVYDFFGYGYNQYKHVHFAYHQGEPTRLLGDPIYFNVDYNQLAIRPISERVSEIGEYNVNGYRIGEWKHFDMNQNLFKLEKYLIPHKEEEIVVGRNQ